MIMVVSDVASYIQNSARCQIRESIDDDAQRLSRSVRVNADDARPLRRGLPGNSRTQVHFRSPIEAQVDCVKTSSRYPAEYVDIVG
jgi:hypothetical protein